MRCLGLCLLLLAVLAAIPTARAQSLWVRRDPNTGQDTDYTGFDFWLTKLNNAPGNHDQAYINAEMVRSFIVSQEYRGRF